MSSIDGTLTQGQYVLCLTSKAQVSDRVNTRLPMLKSLVRQAVTWIPASSTRCPRLDHWIMEVMYSVTVWPWLYCLMAYVSVGTRDQVKSVTASKWAVADGHPSAFHLVNHCPSNRNNSRQLYYFILIFVCKTAGHLFYSILGCVLPLQEEALRQSSTFLCPLLSLSIPLLVVPQCHLSNDVLVFRLILHPLSATLCFY